MRSPILLIIRDGWGINPNGKEKAQEDGNATLLASTPYHDYLYKTYPMSRLSASGPDVGLPEGQMGNSEVGHLNIGAGRIVYQDLVRINLAIENGSLAKNEVLCSTFEKAAKSRLHLIGLVSDGGVHSHQQHLIALANLAAQAGINEILVHAITDGRDTSPTGGKAFLETCEEAFKNSGATIATVVGRYFAMDRDQRWDRTKLAWDAIVFGRGEKSTLKPSQAIAKRYAEGQTDEFLKPLIFSNAEEQRVLDEDVILFFNFRADRARQLSSAFLSEDFDHFNREVAPKVHYVTLTEYSADYSCPAVFHSQTMNNILGKVVSDAGLKQFRIAETEKYPHVTYFFNGGEETAYPGEDRMIIPSPKVATYDLQPEMSAHEVTQKLLPRLKDYALIILNFANPDMVGHTGIVEAGIKAIETIDTCVQQVLEELLRLGGKALVTADHGNSERLRNPDGSPHTAHTTNLVHFIYVGEDHTNIKCKDGILADIAPTILHLLHLKLPLEMTGKNLLETISQD